MELGNVIICSTCLCNWVADTWEQLYVSPYVSEHLSIGRNYYIGSVSIGDSLVQEKNIEASRQVVKCPTLAT
jgi:hypothetical protein